jgi:hypothetical protein
VRSNRLQILAVSRAYGIRPEAIAGAILWDAMENPYRRRFLRLGPGKVHPVELLRRSEAEIVEREGLVKPPTRNAISRFWRLRQPGWAITYIAAIMRRHANNYLAIAGIDISDEPTILCTLLQGGHSEARAARLAERIRTNPSARPVPGDQMGPWVGANLAFIHGVLGIERGFEAV